ncbi:MAG: alpha-amylase family protein [Acidimicrobiales bacterium]|nr:alpha-amylase family protein [Acidimicrobiales bacterium]
MEDHYHARRARGLTEVRPLLHALYADRRDVELDRLIQRIGSVLDDAHAARPAALRRIDAERLADPGWFQAAARIGYVAYVDRFAGTLGGVTRRLPLLEELHVDLLYLMKVQRARPEPNDGGYAVVDYLDVDPALGTWSDLEHLTATLHERGIGVCLDLVMNHTAREHAWAEAARRGSARHRAYYLVFPDRQLPDLYEEHLQEVFPDLAPGNFTWDDELAAWVWTTFHDYQWDLDYGNPEVFVEMLGVMLSMANAGVDVLRLDAIAFTWKRMGTNCQNQPEAHLLAQAFRALTDVAAPGLLLLAEAIVSPGELVPYLGAHRLQRRECHLAYHNQLMVQIWSALATGDARLATESLASLPPTPATATWTTYVRCHDDIGWAVDDEVAGRVGIDGGGHRAYLAAFYRGDVPGSDALGAAFSTNAATADERTVGTAAALCGLEAARARGDRLAEERAIRRLLLAHGVILGFPGIPLLYMGDELALSNDATYLADPALVEDTRWMNRPWLDEEVLERRHVAGSVEARVFAGLRRLVEARRATPAMAAGGQLWLHRYDDPAVLAWQRHHPVHGGFFGLANFSDQPATVPAASPGWAGLHEPIAIVDDGVTVMRDRLVLPPLSVTWYVDRADAPVVPAPVPTGRVRPPDVRG